MKEAQDLQDTGMGVGVGLGGCHAGEGISARGTKDTLPRLPLSLRMWMCSFLLGYTLSSFGAGPMAFIFIARVYHGTWPIIGTDTL